MAQCYQCGSSVEPDDRFCMQCGADYPARRPNAPPAATPAVPGKPGGIAVLPAPPLPSPVQVAPPGSPGPAVPPQPPQIQAGQAASPYPTTPTWLPAEGTPNLVQKPTSPLQTADKAPEAASISCPKCGSKLPAGARFCGDCGKRLSGALPAVPAPGAGFPAHPPSAALPEPIPPLVVGPPPRPSAPIAQPVLPPFRAPGWADQPAPDVELPDDTLTPLLTTADPQAAPGNPPVWGQATPFGAQAANSSIQPSPWAPGQLQGPGNAGSFQPPFGSAQPAGSAAPFQAPPGRAASPHAAFLQAMAAVPPPKPQRRALSRGQAITMIVAAIITLGATIGGVLTIFLSR